MSPQAEFMSIAIVKISFLLAVLTFLHHRIKLKCFKPVNSNIWWHSKELKLKGLFKQKKLRFRLLYIIPKLFFKDIDNRELNFWLLLKDLFPILQKKQLQRSWQGQGTFAVKVTNIGQMFAAQSNNFLICVLIGQFYRWSTYLSEEK